MHPQTSGMKLKQEFLKQDEKGYLKRLRQLTDGCFAVEFRLQYTIWNQSLGKIWNCRKRSSQQAIGGRNFRLKCEIRVHLKKPWGENVEEASRRKLADGYLAVYFRLKYMYICTWTMSLGKYKMMKKLTAGNWRMYAWQLIWFKCTLNKSLGKYKMMKKLVADNWRMDAWPVFGSCPRQVVSSLLPGSGRRGVGIHGLDSPTNNWKSKRTEETDTRHNLTNDWNLWKVKGEQQTVKDI